MPSATHLRASREQAWEPMASSSVNFCRKHAPYRVYLNVSESCLLREVGLLERKAHRAVYLNVSRSWLLRGAGLLEREEHRAVYLNVSGSIESIMGLQCLDAIYSANR
jgi:hypothetical protein